MARKLRILLKILSFVSIAMMTIGFAFPEWYRVSSNGSTAGLWQDCIKNEFEEGSGIEQTTVETVTVTLENDTTDSNDTIAEADPEPEPECVLKSVEKLNEQLWIVVPATIGLFFSVIGFFILTVSLEAQWVQIGADGHIIGSLLYLIGIGTWLNGPTNDSTASIGWALIVGIAGMILNFLIGLSARSLRKPEKAKAYEEHDEIVNPYTETDTTTTVPDHLTAM